MSYQEHFAKEKKLSALIAAHGPLQVFRRENICLYLCGSIMSQQLSIKVADVIFKRFLNLFPGGDPTPEQILALSVPELRAIGLSNAKASYVQNVARFASVSGMEFSKLDAMSDEEVIAYLTPIKGVGRWTVEMLLMFALGREDVFALDDFGIQSAMKRLYKLDDSDKKTLKAAMMKRARKWSPYRSYACLHLWKL